VPFQRVSRASIDAIVGGMAEPTAPQAVRFVFAYDGDDVRLLSRRRVGVLAPPSDAIEEPVGNRRGFWAEVRAVEGATLYRKAMPPVPPIRHDREVFSDEPGDSLSRIPVERPAGIFTVLVPDSPEADHLALVSGRPGGVRTLLATTGETAGGEILRVSMRGAE
jgi:hypothetical protein